jgi:GT2 family glycosyltransferase
MATVFHADSIISIDSSVAHMGIAFNKPVFSIHNITDHERFLHPFWWKLASYHDKPEYGIHGKVGPLPAEFEPVDKIKLCQNMMSIKPVVLYEKIKCFYEMRKKKTKILITTFGDTVKTEACVMSIIKNTRNFDYGIVISDDGSEKVYQDKLDVFSRVATVVLNKVNVGFTKHAFSSIYFLDRSETDLVILMNNDMEILTSNWIDIFQRIMRNKMIGVVGVKLLYPNMKIQHCGVVMNKDRVPEHIFKNMSKDFPLANIPRFYNSVTGACICFRYKDFKTVGGYDTEYRNSAEDIDFCFSIKEKLGKKILYCPEIELIHYEGATLGTNKPFEEENRERLRTKFPSLTQTDIEGWLNK